MSLIEYLEENNWQEVLRRTFEYTLEVLKNDRFRTVSSSVDDLRSWLAVGGVSRVREHLNNQMEARRFLEAKQVEVNKFLEQLVHDNRQRLLDLTAQGILQTTQQEWLSSCGLTNMQFENVLIQILAGERPFEDWMHAHGHSDEAIQKLYGLIDHWLIHCGTVVSPRSGPLLN